MWPVLLARVALAADPGIAARAGAGARRAAVDGRTDWSEKDVCGANMEYC